jgi:1,4-dihydroxy-2-naphthoate polyprenyltransferase
VLKASTIQLLRFHFSFFLLPVYLFALSGVPVIDWRDALHVFFILHLLVYPASNGYNSYMDRDEESIGGIKNPMQPTKQLFYVTIIMDIAAVLLSLAVSIYFSAGILAYILVSRAYSYRNIRLKKYPFVGYLTVIIFQGAVTYWLVYHGSSAGKSIDVPGLPVIISSLLIGGFYPLTQIYQHEADRKDNVKSLSYKLGYRGTFIFCALVYTVAMSLLFYYFFSQSEQLKFLLLATCMLPIPVYFFIWAARVWKDERQANFSNTMRMNIIASVCTNTGFMVLITGRAFE